MFEPKTIDGAWTVTFTMLALLVGWVALWVL